MERRALWISMTCLAVGLSGCGGSSEGNSDGGEDAQRLDAPVASVDARPDREIIADAAKDARRDGSIVAEAGPDAESIDASTEAGDAAGDAGSDGMGLTDALVDA